jgi:hypothetical protein
MGPVVDGARRILSDQPQVYSLFRGSAKEGFPTAGEHKVKYMKVRGRNGAKLNEKADALAKEGRERLLLEGSPA